MAVTGVWICWLGCYGFARFLVGTWWVLFCLFIFFNFGFLVTVGFFWVEDSGGMVGMVVAWW